MSIRYNLDDIKETLSSVENTMSNTETFFTLTGCHICNVTNMITSDMAKEGYLSPTNDPCEFCFVTWINKKHCCDTLRYIFTTIEKVDGKRKYKIEYKDKSEKDFNKLKGDVIKDAKTLLDTFNMDGYLAWLEEKKADPQYKNDKFKKKD